MLKQEFETIAKVTVSPKQYEVINALYMESDLDKYDFVKGIKKILDSFPKQEKKRIVTITTTDKSGYETTPNGCYYHLVDYELIDISVKTGKIQLKKIDGSYRLGYSFDYHHYDSRLEIIEG